MGRKKKDVGYQRASEWRRDGGGKKSSAEASRGSSGSLPFDCCALSLQPFETPVCTPDGIIFDLLSIVPYVKKHGKSPATGEPVDVGGLLRLQMQKDAEGRWVCPSTRKPFTNFSRVVAIKTTGNVFSYDAVEELNIRAQNWKDLLSDAAFAREDILWLQDPQNASLSALRNIANFDHTAPVSRAAAAHASKTLQNSQRVAQEARERLKGMKAPASGAAPAAAAGADRGSSDFGVLGGGAPLAALERRLASQGQKILRSDLIGGVAYSDGRDALALTSGVLSSRGGERCATADEKLSALHSEMKGLGKKGFAQLRTSLGNVNVEIHADLCPKTAHNFLGLCATGYYNGTTFHRVIPGFMAQGGDPKGEGTGGECLWGGKFSDEFDRRLRHSTVGVLSMANSGADTNGSQFFVTFAPAPHLDDKHSIFGRVVGGLDVLRAIEGAPTGQRDRPLEPIVITEVKVFNDVAAEAEAALAAQVEEHVKRRVARVGAVGRGARVAAPAPARASAQQPAGGAAGDGAQRDQTVGKYINSAALPAAARRAKTKRGGALEMPAPKRARPAPKRPGTGAAAREPFSDFSSW